MARQRGNPNWMRPDYSVQVVPRLTEFEQLVAELELRPDQYVDSTRLRQWAQRHKNDKFIPESLLKAWGFHIDGEEVAEYRGRHPSLAA